MMKWKLYAAEANLCCLLFLWEKEDKKKEGLREGCFDKGKV